MGQSNKTQVDRPLRIALNELGGKQWTGGITYRNNLVKALAMVPDAAEVFLVQRDNPVDGAGTLPVIVDRPVGPVTRKLNGAARKIFKQDYRFGRLLGAHDIDVVFPHTMRAGKSASIYWIPDFQFMHLEKLYSPAERAAIVEKMRRYFSDVRLILLSSQDALNDLRRFFPEFASSGRVVRFVAHVPSGLYQSPPSAVVERYHLPTDFVYLPNQFWAHKNHMLVLEALGILKSRGVPVHVVCTGNPVDSRDPQYFARLMLQIATLGVGDRITILGMVPHDDVYALIRQSKCVLNPSRFEGWSTGVEESKSVGKRMLLSNLAVHIEQAAPASAYFGVDDAEGLANALEQVWREAPAGPDAELEAAARAALPTRMREFADNFIAVCREATGNG